MKLSPAPLVFLAIGAPSQGFTTPQTHLSSRSRTLHLFSTATPVTPTTLTDQEILSELESAAESIASDVLDNVDCIVDPTTGDAVDELCSDESLYFGVKRRLKQIVRGTLGLLRSTESASEEVDAKVESYLFGDVGGDEEEIVPEGEFLERGWTKRGNSSALRRNAEVWKFTFKSVFKVLGARKLRKAGDDNGAKKAEAEAALFIRDGLLRLGPTFVKLGQVVSTRTDVLPKTYTDVLKTLQDDVPGFSGKRAKEIVSVELGKPCDEIFTNFSSEPIAAASLGQVHTATYKGQKVAVKVQRAGLKELFDVDLKNLKKLAELLDKFDPKTDGADRDWVAIYEESERLLYLEIDYLNEAANAERFAKDFSDVDWVRVPEVFREVSTPRVLTMQFLESFKLTDLEKIDRLGLNRELLAKRTADAFLRQIVETGYFHCHGFVGNLCVDTQGNLVYYDFGMMDELKPNVRSGFRKFCTALFAVNAKSLVDGVEEAGVLARGADRLAVEKLARYFMRTFKDNQLGKKKGSNIKESVGTDLQTLTENDVFRFPSTFTFIFRSFASIDGIGKGLSENFDLGKLAQPFIEKFTEVQKNETPAEKSFNIFTKATGLNSEDILKTVSSPKKIAYIEDTLRSIERGELKIRVRSLENEKALERMALTQSKMEKLLAASLLLNFAGMATSRILRSAGLVGALAFGFQIFAVNAKIKKFDKTQAKFVATKFVDDE
eukprot:CCRYP_016551-RB/>CCRYP_016551-RB protein AED:0.07 eAED:0.07 QI:73/0.25/0.4/1/0.25/0.4/5/0/720